MMTKRKYLALLMQQSPEWVRASMRAPGRHMRAMHVLLHRVALRRMGAHVSRCYRDGAFDYP
jgi:hypothetical protein